MTSKAFKNAANLRGLRTVYEFGAKGDGVADDTAALQAALDSNMAVLVPPGRYRITAPLVVQPTRNRGCGLIGTTSWSMYPDTSQAGGPTWDGTKEAVIFWDGGVDATKAMLRASASDVGVEVVGTFDKSIFGLSLRDIVFDGDDKVGFGVYGIRLAEPDVVHVAVRGTTRHAWYLGGLFSGRFASIAAVFNVGCGISVGRGALDYGWSNNFSINGVEFADLYARANGADKAFDEVSNPLWGYGIGLWWQRGNVLTSYTSELNDGPNLVLSPEGAGNVIEGGYSELANSYSVGGTTAIVDGRSTEKWGIWFAGQAGGISTGNVARSLFSGSEYIRLTGTEPSSGRPEGGFEIHAAGGWSGVSSDWANYRLVNPNLECVAGMTGTAPAGYLLHHGGLRLNGGDALTVYKQGSWTPAFEGAGTAGTGWTYTLAVGYWERIGRRVFFNCRITVSGIGAGAAGNLLLTGLPYNIANTNNAQASVSVGRVLNLVTNVVSASAVGVIDSKTLAFYLRTAAAASETQMTVANIQATTSFTLSGAYATSDPA